jgi:hypothetical protein
MREGWSRTDPAGGWRMFLLDELTDVSTLPEQFGGPRADFNPNDRHFVEVYCRLSPAEAALSDAQPTATPFPNV